MVRITKFDDSDEFTVTHLDYMKLRKKRGANFLDPISACIGHAGHAQKQHAHVSRLSYARTGVRLGYFVFSFG